MKKKKWKRTKWKQYLKNLWKHSCILHNAICNPFLEHSEPITQLSACFFKAQMPWQIKCHHYKCISFRTTSCEVCCAAQTIQTAKYFLLSKSPSWLCTHFPCIVQGNDMILMEENYTVLPRKKKNIVSYQIWNVCSFFIDFYFLITIDTILY